MNEDRETAAIEVARQYAAARDGGTTINNTDRPVSSAGVPVVEGRDSVPVGQSLPNNLDARSAARKATLDGGGAIELGPGIFLSHTKVKHPSAENAQSTADMTRDHDEAIASARAYGKARGSVKYTQ